MINNYLQRWQIAHMYLTSPEFSLRLVQMCYDYELLKWMLVLELAWSGTQYSKVAFT